MEKVLHYNNGPTGKPINYISDGKFRDRYISYNSGGNMKEIPFPMGSINSGIVNKRFYSIG
jgi:hypothetical protein